MTTSTLVVLSVLLAIVVVAVLALALIEVRRRLHSTSQTLATLAGALEMVEAEHLRTLEPAVRAINAQFDIITSALPGIALAKQGGNGRNHGSGSSGNTSDAQGGGPPACRDLEGSIDQLQSMLNSLNTQIATINANVNTINSNTNNLSARIDAINASITTMNTTLNTFTTRFDSIESSLDVLSEDIADIKATLDTEGVNAVQASVDVNTTACASGASQCGSTTVPNSTNQNPVALNILVTDGSTPITNLSSSNFLFNVPFTPNVRHEPCS